MGQSTGDGLGRVVIRVVWGVVGVVIVAVVLDAAVRTFLLPRVSTVRLTRVVAGSIGQAFRLVAGESRRYETRDRVLALYPPVVLLSFQAVWLALTWLGCSMLLPCGAPCSTCP